jgi:hypothetical protein
MLSLSALGTLALLPQAVFQGATTPPSGDTLGYWQQHVAYTIVATLDESHATLHGHGTLVYVNNSPDTLREMFFQQYLNAFRPGSKWSAADARENRVRFQYLQDPNYGFERFTRPPTVNGVAVVVDYPGAPDSTVAHFRLPAPLPPHDSVRVTLDWDARPSTLPRRQGRAGRTYDFAQWYPKVVVYDRGGWEPNAFQPAGELYGEYGTYDVTMVVRDDQVIASTGVPVSGDPGWARVSRTGPPRLASNAYDNVPPPPAVTVPDGDRAVRFYAENVHHFAWSTSPDYRYEGGLFVRPVPHVHFPTWDTVSINVLYKPGDDSTWGGGRAVDRSIRALQWLESIWGPYAYPQFTNIHRIEGGGTEFPMMIMNGGASYGLILHEGGHQFTYGILGNNEWRSGWMDEGFTSYQTDWAQGLTPQEQIGKPVVPPLLPQGYRVEPVTIPHSDSIGLADWQLEIAGRTQPIGTNSGDFHEFGIYNQMIYNRAKLMYGQLRDVLGDSAFRAFLHDYYMRWALKHVDERAMRASAERAYGHDLGWFFDEWVHGTGLMDYAAGPYSIQTDGHLWRTSVTVERRGELRHPMPVGVRTAAGWTIARADPLLDRQTVVVTTNAAPLGVALDPYHTTWDWDWRNNAPASQLLDVRDPKLTYDWPYLDQADRSHTIVALAPAAWYSTPESGVLGIRAHSNYLGAVDLQDAGAAFAFRSPFDTAGNRASTLARVQLWARAQNPYLPGTDRPLMGWGADANWLDGILKLDLSKNWDVSPFIYTPGPDVHANAYATFASATAGEGLLPEQWNEGNVLEVGGGASYRTFTDVDSSFSVARLSAAGGVDSRTGGLAAPAGLYFRGDASIGAVRPLATNETLIRLRLYGGIAHDAPIERAIFASSQDPFATFDNDLFRPQGALLKQDGINYLPLGGAGLHGVRYDLPLDGVVAANGELSQHLGSAHGGWGSAAFSFNLFGDAAAVSTKTLPSVLAASLTDSFLSDAGAGLAVRGRLYDRELSLRLDAPVFVNQASFAGGKGLGGNGSLAPRWTITVGDLW